jgi:hypothetical protein
VKRLIIEEGATAELDAAAERYEGTAGPVVAWRFMQAVAEVIESVHAAPSAWPLSPTPRPV